MDRTAGFKSPFQAEQLSTAVSKRIVAIVPEYCGRGPTETKTFVRDDLLLMRRNFEKATSERFTDAIEEFTGRKVLALLPQASVEPDLAVEIFLLDRPIDAPSELTDHRRTHGAYPTRSSWGPSPD